MDADFSDLNILAQDLENVPSKAGPLIRKAVEVTANKVKSSARERVSGRKELDHAATAIDYELKGFQGFGATVLDAEIGYNKGKSAGKLGNLVEFGAPNAGNQLAPGGELQAALGQNEADFESGLAKAIDDALRASGL